MFRIILGIILYFVFTLLSQDYLSEIFDATWTHGVSLVLAVFIPCLLARRGLPAGYFSYRTFLVVMLVASSYKLLQVAVILPSTPDNMIGQEYWIFLMGLVLVSIFEELFFRGVVFDDLLRKYNIYVAALVSVTIFAMIHYPTSTGHLIFHFVSGTFFVFLRIKFSGVLMPIVAHVVGNLTVFFYLNGLWF